MPARNTQHVILNDGSGSTRPDTNSASESTWPRINSAGSTRPLIFFYITGGVFYKCMMLLDMNNDFIC